MEDFVTYEQAVKLKECGFDEPCIYYYNSAQQLLCAMECVHSPKVTNNRYLDEIGDRMATVPTLSQAAKWLREVKGIIIVCTPEIDEYDFNDYIRKCITGQWCYELWRNGDEHWNFTEKLYSTYESALSAGIDAALKLIKE